MTETDPTTLILNQTSGTPSDLPEAPANETKTEEKSEKTYPSAEIPSLNKFSKDPVSKVLLQGGSELESDNPMEDLLRSHDSNTQFNGLPEENAGKTAEDPNNPVIVLTNDDDDDDDGPITLSVRQPSYSSLHGALVQKGSLKSLPEPETLLDSVDEQPNTQNKVFKAGEFTSSAERLKIELGSQENPVIVASTDDDDNEDGEQTIGLSMRQPSFSNLRGQLIPKGASPGKVLPSLDEEGGACEPEDPNCAYGTMFRTKSKTDASKKDDDEDQFEDKLEEKDKEEGAPIKLGVRQPSFSNLNGQMILKGSVTALPKFNEDDVIVEDEDPKEDAQQILLDKISAQDPVHGEILRSLHQFNEERWKDLGYDPNKESEAVLNSSLSAADDEVSSNLSSHKSCNLYPKIVEVTKEIKDEPSKEECTKRRVLSSRQSSKLNVEMPDSYKSTKNQHKERPYEEGDVLETEAREFSDSEEHEKEVPRQINSAGGQRNQSQLFDILPDSMIKSKEEIYDDSTAAIEEGSEGGESKKSKKSNKGKKKSKKQNNEDGLDEDFYLSLDDLRNTQGYDSEQGSSRIPPNLYKMITHPKESVVFLSLCGVSIAGYSEKTVNYVNRELKGYLNKCVDKGMIEESMYVQNILNNIKEERNMMKKADDEVNEELLSARLIEANEEMAKREQYWDRQEEQLDAQKEVAINELEIKKNDAIEELNEEWSTEKMQSRYNKPSAKLIELRRTAQRMIGAHRFEEAAFLAEEISNMEDEESAIAARRMDHDYRMSVKRLNKKYDQERDTIDSTFETRRNAIKCSKEKSLIPVHNRAARVQHQKDKIREKKTLMERKERASRITKAAIENNRKPLPKLRIKSVAANRKLILPPLKKVNRPSSSAQTKE